MFALVRVRRPLRTWTLMVGTAGFGFLHGLNLWFGWIWLPSVIGHDIADTLVEFAIPLLPWVIVVHYRCQRVVPLIAAGLLCGLSSAFGFFYTSAMGSPLGGAAIMHQPLMLQYSLRFAVGVAMFNMVALFLTTCVIGYRLVEQDGSMCKSCGYRLIGARCSECGLSNLTLGKDRRDLLCQAGVALLLIGAAVSAGWALWQPTREDRVQFIAEFGAEGSFHGHMYSEEGMPMWSAVGVFYWLDEAGMLLCWLEETAPQPDQPSMQLQVMAAYCVPAGYHLPIPAEPMILVNVKDHELAAHLRRHGVSPASRHLIQQIAEDEGWRPIAPATAPSRVIVVSPEVIFEEW